MNTGYIVYRCSYKNTHVKLVTPIRKNTQSTKEYTKLYLTVIQPVFAFNLMLALKHAIHDQWKEILDCQTKRLNLKTKERFGFKNLMYLVIQ